MSRFNGDLLVFLLIVPHSATNVDSVCFNFFQTEVINKNVTSFVQIFKKITNLTKVNKHRSNVSPHSKLKGFVNSRTNRMLGNVSPH
jgi:hypothetical protein